jgi:hypothetical protein
MGVLSAIGVLSGKVSKSIVVMSAKSEAGRSAAASSSKTLGKSRKKTLLLAKISRHNYTPGRGGRQGVNLSFGYEYVKEI